MVVKGPLTVTPVVAFVQGRGSLYVRAHGLAFDLFERHPALGIPNDFGVPEPPERVACLGHLVTNWMGNAGFLRRLSVKVLRHNLIGDTTWRRGRVTGKAPGGVATLEMDGTNQRDEIIASGTAEVVLPTR
jgi:hypothetical protein